MERINHPIAIGCWRLKPRLISLWLVVGLRGRACVHADGTPGCKLTRRDLGRQFGINYFLSGFPLRRLLYPTLCE